MSDTTWATVRLVLRATGGEREQLLEAIDRLESVAMMLADHAAVGGVETRDPFTIAEGPDFRAVEVPELIAYTIPAERAVVEAAALELASQFALDVEVESADHEGDDWRDAWKRYYRPLRFVADDGSRSLLVRPSWIARAADDPRAELVLDPGRAFGTGLHESTRLCLQALVELAGKLEPRTLIDLGCGSGILGLAALQLFPTLEHALLVDHDPESTETARENAELNSLGDRVETREVLLGEGDTTRMLAGPHALVLANIRPSVLIPCAPAIVELLAPGGALVLSGILVEEGDEVRAAYPSLIEVERRRENDWVALILRREAA
ncbi:50S ribosomal protein L11 methyltransferase [Nannocystaceae bacterium ST9]